MSKYSSKAKYSGQLQAVVSRYQDAGILFEGPFVLYKRPRVGDLDVRPYTPNMAEGIKASGAPVFAVFPKKDSGHRDISELDGYIRSICADPKNGLIDADGEPRIKCHRAPNLGTALGSLCVRINNWAPQHPETKSKTPDPDKEFEAKDIYLSYSNSESGGAKKAKAETTYF
tara:strand:+ start:66 stop:581 length:516 start_codon:yes stop_codon:yes gene_type:complete